MNFQKINDFRSSLCYRPWGIQVGVSVSYPTRAVAQLLGESRAYAINNIPALVWIMAWHQPGDKSSSEPMMVRLPTHLCVTPPQCIKMECLTTTWSTASDDQDGVMTPSLFNFCQFSLHISVNETLVVKTKSFQSHTRLSVWWRQGSNKPNYRGSTWRGWDNGMNTDNPHTAISGQHQQHCTLNQQYLIAMGHLPDMWNCGLRMRRECWERFPHHWLQRKPLVGDPGMHHGTCDARAVTHQNRWPMVAGKTFPAFTSHAQPATLCIW